MSKKIILTLYHGSNRVVRFPRTDKNKYLSDFGNGFYLTSNIVQAKNWAKRKARLIGEPTVNIFVWHLSDNTLNIKQFNANNDWAKYVLQNRTKIIKSYYDLIIGPTADGRLFSVINDWKNGKLNLDQALIKLKPEVYDKQYCFKTEKALHTLKYIGREVLTND